MCPVLVYPFSAPPYRRRRPPRWPRPRRPRRRRAELTDAQIAFAEAFADGGVAVGESPSESHSRIQSEERSLAQSLVDNERFRATLDGDAFASATGDACKKESDDERSDSPIKDEKSGPSDLGDGSPQEDDATGSDQAKPLSVLPVPPWPEGPWPPSPSPPA